MTYKNFTTILEDTKEKKWDWREAQPKKHRDNIHIFDLRKGEHTILLLSILLKTLLFQLFSPNTMRVELNKELLGDIQWPTIL